MHRTEAAALARQAVACRLCGEALDDPRLDFGMVPVTNAFSRDGAFETVPLALSACCHCGLIQLCDNPPVETLTPRIPWIRYNEPEAHLEMVASRLLALLPERPSVVIGIGPFDRPLLERLSGATRRCTSIDLLQQARTDAPVGRFPYLETIQARVTTDDLARLCERIGAADLVVFRYLLEHCHDPLASLLGLRSLLTEQGLLLIEVPDSTAFLERNDYSFVWEEHVSYFTEATVRSMAAAAGGEVLDMIRAPGSLEDSLVAIIRFGPRAVASYAAPDDGLRLLERYASAFPPVREAWQRLLSPLKAAGHGIAIFGAGHQAIMFANLIGLDAFDPVMVDDAVEKQGLVPPGLRAPIRSSTAMLADASLSICLLAVNPAIEARILHKCAPLLARGGHVYSIFRGPYHGPLAIETL